LAREFGVLDRQSIEDLPFSVWLDHFQDELLEPFLDRRIDTQAFLITRVLAAVIQVQLTPTEEMFLISAPLSAAARATAAGEETAEPLDGFQIGMAAAGWPSYTE
jgi:hypothetical protein